MGDANWVKNFTPQADGDAEWAEGMRYLFDDAKEKIGDVQKAIACFMQGAQLGNANCMRQLASCYESGCGVPQDFAKAHEWRAKGIENHLRRRKEKQK